MTCPHCDGPVPARRNFCPHCKKVVGDLSRIRINGFTGRSSMSPKMQRYWETGDPAVFAKPGAPDYNPAYD